MTDHDVMMAHRAVAAMWLDRDVIELRALRVRTSGSHPRTISGYFDDPKRCVEGALKIHGAEGIFVTLNPVTPALLARAANRARVCASGDATTTDKDVSRRVLLFVDFDATRPSGISATDDEKATAIARATAARSELSARGWSEPIFADSGNGAHLLYRVDLPVDDGGLTENVLQALAARYSDDAVTVDTTTHNASRLIPVYGTVKAKGDDTPDRPHRVTKILEAPEELVAVSHGHLEALAAMAPDAVAAPRGTARHQEFDVDGWLGHHGLSVRRGPSGWSGGTRWVLDTCPFNSDHSRGEAFVVQLASGAIAAGCLHASCTWRWQDLRAKYDPGQPDKTDKSPFGGFVSSPSGRSQKNAVRPTDHAWPTPLPLPEELPPVPPFDLGLLPQKVRPWIEDITNRMQCPPDYAAVAVMVTIAGLVGRKISIRPKKHDDWEVVPNLWGAVIGRPGVLKTPSIQEASRGLSELEAAAKKAFEDANTDHERQALISEERAKIAKQAISKAIKDGRDPTEIAQTIISEQLEDPPIRRRYKTNDATVEKLGELLRDNPNGIVVFRDELVGLLRGLDKEGHESARAFYLESWNGTGSFIYDRIGRGTIDIPAAIISILGGIQPGPLSKYLRACTTHQGDDGLIQRFQLLVWPDVGPWRNVDSPPNATHRAAATDLFEWLDTFEPFYVGAVIDDPDTQRRPYLRFAPDAQLRFDEWRAALEQQLRNHDEHPAFESHLAKYRSLIPSLALLTHLAEGRTGPVCDDALIRAIRWGVYLLAHARRVYASIEAPEIASARALAKRIAAGSFGALLEKRDIYRHGWSDLSTAADVQAALDVLEDLDWLRKVTETTAGAPRTRYVVNPRVREMVAPPPDKTDKRPDSNLLAVLAGPPPTDPDASDAEPTGADRAPSEEAPPSAAEPLADASGGSESPDAHSDWGEL